MYSFYGGKPGNSFIIITTYRSINDMVSNFRLGSNYTAVHYDQHVMINTVNKNDPDNGKIYRRGYDFTNEMGGAQYIGTIVGPSGMAPMLEMTTVTNVKTKHGLQGYDERYTTGTYSINNSSLVPGRTQNGTYNDSISWACCSIRNENDEDCTAYIGFTFPYMVIDYEINSVEPYSSLGQYTDTSSITRIDDKKHPFFEKWHIDIPKGIKGDSFKNLQVQVADSTIEEYEGQADDINNNREVLVYQYYNYDSLKTGDPKKIYLGDYNMIDDVLIGQDGTITIKYNHDDDEVFNKLIKWIDNISVADNGTLTITWNNDTANTVFNKKIKWITAINISNTGDISVNYNTGDSTTLQSKVKWIDSINLSNDGILTINYNTGDSESLTNNKIKWINNMNLTNGYRLTFTYNDSTSETIDLILPYNIVINTGETEGTGNQKIRVSWTDGQYADIGNPINYVMEMAINNDEHLLVRYSDPERRNLSTTVTWNQKAGWTDIGSLKVPYIYGDPTATNLKWSGTGMITNSESGYLNVTFTMPLTQLLDQNITAVNIASGRLYITSQGGNHNLTNFVMNSTNTTITKTLSGLEFQIQTEYQNLEVAQVEIATIFINQLNLSFVR